MAILRPDIYEHNNPLNAIVDSNFTRGGTRTPVQNLSDLYQIGSGVNDRVDQLKQHSTRVYVSGEGKFYTLTDLSNRANSSGWSPENFISSGTLSGYLTTGYSGWANNTFATITNLTNTINSLSGLSVLITGNQIISGDKTFVNNVEIVAPVSGMYGTGNLLNALNVRGFASVGADLSSLTGIFNTGAVGLSGVSPGQFSAGGMLIGQNEGGAYLGRVGVRENSWQVLSGTEGVNWTARMTDSNRLWWNIAMSSDGRIQTAVVQNGQIFTSYDYGVTWTARDSSRQWVSIAMSSDGRIQTAGVFNGQIYVSYDYGVNWTARNSSREWTSIAMSSDGRIQTAVVNGGQIYTSYNYGVTWTARPPNRSWQGIAMSSDGRIQTAVVASGHIHTSYDYGVTWTARMTNGNRFWYSIAMSSDGRIQAAVVQNGQIFTSYDYGVTWTARDSGSRAWWFIAMSSDGRIQTAVVNGGQIYTSYNYGVNWTARMTDSNRNWRGIAMSSDGRIQTAVNYSIPTTGYIYTSYATTVTPNPINVLGSITSYDNINVVSGNLFISGNPVLTGIPDSFWATQSELDSTGLALVNRIDSLSGSLNSSGISLTNTINSLSGSAVLIYGNQIISGNKTFVNNVEIQGTGIFNNLDLSNISSFSFSGVTIDLINSVVNSLGQILISGNPVLTGIPDSSWATQSELDLTGLALVNRIDSLSGSLNSTGINLLNIINSLSGNVVFLTGDQNISGVKNFYSRPTVNGTGVLLSGEAASLPTTIVYTTGDQIISGNKTFVNNINVSGTGIFNALDLNNIDSLSLSGIDISITGSTVNVYGNIFISGNPVLTGIPDSFWATQFELDSTGLALVNRIDSLSGSLNSSGISLTNTINSLSGTLTSNYATITNLGLTGIDLTNTINSLSGSLNSSGISLTNTINSLSGTLTSNYATITNLGLTGIDLTNTINSLSGSLNSSGINLVNRISALSGQVVFTTGSQIINGAKIFTTGIDIYSGTSPQSIRVFNWTGTNSGEFGLFGWVNNELRIGATQTQSGLLRDVLLTGRNININASGALNIFDPTNISGDLNVTGNILLSGNNILSIFSSLSGSLNSTGINLFNTISSLSGSLNNTGVNLLNRINSLSGNVVFLTGNQNIGGNKTFTGITTFSGQEVNLVDTALNLSGVGDMTFSGTNINFINSPVLISGTDLRVSGNVLAYNLNNIVYTTGNQLVSGVKTFANNVIYPVSPRTSGTNFTPNADLYTFFDFVLTGNSTLNEPTNMSNGESITIFLNQDSSGSRTMSFNSAYLFSNGIAPSLNFVPSGVDIMQVIRVNNRYFSTFASNY